MIPTSLRVLCALAFGGLPAFAQEKLHIYTFDRLPAALKAAPPQMAAGGTWAFNPSAPEAFTAGDTTINRLTYEGLELNGAANTNGFVSFTYGDTQTLDLRRFSRIEVTVAGLPDNQLNTLSLELGSTTGGVTRRTVFYVGAGNPSRFGDKVVFNLASTNVWHRDGGIPYNRSSVKTITLSSNWPASPLATRLIIRDLHAVTDSLMEPAYFANNRIFGFNNWSALTKNGNRIVLPAGATADPVNGLYLSYLDANSGLNDERDLTGHEYLDFEARVLSGNNSDLRIDLKSTDGGSSFWIIPREDFPNNNLTTSQINLRAPLGNSAALPVNLSRLNGVLITAVSNHNSNAVRWEIGGLRLVPAPAFTYRRGINISHWLSQNYPGFPYASPARFRAALATHLSDLRRGSGGIVAFDHIRIPVEYQKVGNLGGTATNPTFTLIDEEWQNGQLIRGIKPLEDAIAWARGENLGVILDLHSLPGLELGGYNPATPHTLFADTNPNSTQRAQARAVWRALAQRFANHGPWLRFELMNEPVRLPLGTVDSNTRVANVQEDLRRVVRESNPNRVIYLTPNDSGNRGSFWGLQLSQPRYPAFGSRPTTAPANPDALAYRSDKNVAYTLHYYDPVPLTHYGLPTAVPGQTYNTAQTAAQLDAALGPAGAIVNAFSSLRWDLMNPTPTNHYLLEYREVHVGEFGITQSARSPHASLYPRDGSPDVRHHFMRRVRTEVEKHGFAWAAWDYLNTEFSSFSGSGDNPAANTAGQALITP